MNQLDKVGHFLSTAFLSQSRYGRGGGAKPEKFRKSLSISSGIGKTGNLVELWKPMEIVAAKALHGFGKFLLCIDLLVFALIPDAFPAILVWKMEGGKAGGNRKVLQKSV